MTCLRVPRQFDSTKGRAPFAFSLGAGKVIAGWDEGISGMRIGGKRKLQIPYDLGYGEDGSGAIPPKADLNFDCELISIESGFDAVVSTFPGGVSCSCLRVRATVVGGDGCSVTTHTVRCRARRSAQRDSGHDSLAQLHPVLPAAGLGACFLEGAVRPPASRVELGAERCGRALVSTAA
jgi:hypothetical protein